MTMNKKIGLLIVIVSVVVLAVFAGYSMDNPKIISNTNETTLNVSSEGPHELSKIIEEIKTSEYYKGYDNETVMWMESLGDKYVFFSDNEIVIMDKGDANKIPSVFATDVQINEIFSCNVLEKHPIGDVSYPRDVLLVDNVKYITEEMHYYEV